MSTLRVIVYDVQRTITRFFLQQSRKFIICLNQLLQLALNSIEKHHPPFCRSRQWRLDTANDMLHAFLRSYGDAYNDFLEICHFDVILHSHAVHVVTQDTFLGSALGECLRDPVRTLADNRPKVSVVEIHGSVQDAISQEEYVALVANSWPPTTRLYHD